MNSDTPLDSPPADQQHPSAKLPEFNQPAPAGLAPFLLLLFFLNAYLALKLAIAVISEQHPRPHVDVLFFVSMIVTTMQGTIMAFDPRRRKLAYRLLTCVVAMVVIFSLFVVYH